MSGARRATLLAAVMAVLPLGETGCGDCYGGFITAYTYCSDTGAATLESPDGVAVSGPLEVEGLCERSCAAFAKISFVSGLTNGPNAAPLVLYGAIPLQNKLGDTPLTVDIGPRSGARASFVLYANGEMLADLSVVEGSVVITGRTRTSLEATFSATVTTPAGERLIIRNGTVSVSKCRVEEICTNT